MGMNQTPAAERVHISFFGKRNAGKSSVINAVTGQNLAIVSDVKGTTTDPVYKTMELLPLGPVMVVDTPGIDDTGELGTLRVKRSYQVLNKTDIAVLVVDGTLGKTAEEDALIARFQTKGISYLVVYNKLDLMPPEQQEELAKSACGSLESGNSGREIWVSAETRTNIQELKEIIASLKPEDVHKYPIIADLIKPLDLVILVVPIDKAAPKGRLILPQQQTIRAILEAGALSLVVRDTELKATLDHFFSQGIKPAMVVTDSQAFARVSRDTPPDITLTSFSILFARYKGDLETSVRGVAALDSIQDGDKILIAEGCTHHRQCDDIGTFKIPNWIRQYTGREPVFEFTSGTEFPDDMSSYKLVVHCGGCMLNEREMKYRIACCCDQNIPITNYGILIAQVTGILKRSLEPFPEILKILN
ncbi:MAG: [FeFe] hydrogenase H-cluster maturation GTPase HydF [Blautia sp.]|nr:[FeFe] hydrogenase H-cluster maturation GTPase HydF [Blautia sp.]MDY3998060.1 [FeFe] hydrogenase H-cluster maturation GTPase HydF [Blautia sp.]